MHVSTAPPAFTVIAFYGRATDCPGQPLPPQLTPQIEAPRAMMSEPEPPKCQTLEVGAKSYADLAAAIGAALMSLLMFL